MTQKVKNYLLHKLMYIFLGMSYEPIQLIIAAMNLAWGIFLLFINPHDVRAEFHAPLTVALLLLGAVGGFGVLVRECRWASMIFAFVNFLFWSEQSMLLFSGHIQRPVSPVLALASMWLFMRLSAYRAFEKKQWLSGTTYLG